MSAIGDLTQVPPDFMTALGSLRRAHCRNELHLEEIPAPSRLAPFAVALGAEVVEPAAGGTGNAGPWAPEPETLATGRFILLHDPEGSALWEGTFRIVTYIRAQLDADMGNDAMLGPVAWDWLVEALENNAAGYRAAGGTATRILSESFGTLGERNESIDIELRASWTPDGPDVRAHLEAWADMVCSFAGLPPLPEGVSPLPRKRLN